MNNFPSIKELLSTLVREFKILTEMFEKRKKLSFKYDYALALVDDNELIHLYYNKVLSSSFPYSRR